MVIPISMPSGAAATIADSWLDQKNPHQDWVASEEKYTRGLSSPEERSFSCRKSLLAPLIGVPLCAFYCTFGDILSNLLWCGMMILVSYRSIHGLVYAETQTGKGRNLRYFHIGILCYVAAEYALWTSGCFWPGDSIFSPYCWCDLLLTFCLFGLLPATGKAVRT